MNTYRLAVIGKVGAALRERGGVLLPYTVVDEDDGHHD